MYMASKLSEGWDGMGSLGIVWVLRGYYGEGMEGGDELGFLNCAELEVSGSDRADCGFFN